MRRRRGRRSREEVELNLAAMLDMAFQLLAFFIATFRPPELEGQITLRLPPPQARTVQGTQPAGDNPQSNETPKGLKTLTVNVFSDGSGEVRSLSYGDEKAIQMSGDTFPQMLNNLRNSLSAIFGDPTYPYEQVILQVSPSVRYERLMEVVDMLNQLKRSDGTRLSNLTFVEATGG
jgi:biopolymer transport protein ExbD